MEDTIGKRIAAHRKTLGLTQDKLAELLGVTAQAVSKWENDQSCPDIATLPRLAEIFSCTTDSLLGLEQKSEPREEETHSHDAAQPETDESQNSVWELQWDAGRRASAGVALWLVIAGIVSLTSALFGWGTGTWHILWSSGIMVLGFMGLLHRFSGLNLGIFLFGGYFLLWQIGALPESMTVLQWDIVLPGTLLLFGLCLLLDCIRKPKKGAFHISHNGHVLGKSGCHFTCEDTAFDCATNFGENHHLITLPSLSRGRAELNFGELEVDMRGCDGFAPGCTVDLSCTFGELTLTLPKKCRVEPSISTAFAAVDVEGAPAADAEITIYVNGRASFGAITLRYL